MDAAAIRRKDTTKGPPLRILSLDGGGVRGYSMLIILQELMYRTYVECEGKAPHRDQIPKPCDHFDLIVGTGTGGLIALMLGRLRLDLETCKDVYVRMTRRVFETDKTIVGIPYRSTLYKASRLEDAIKQCVMEHTVSESEGNDTASSGGKDPISPISMKHSHPQRTLSRASVSTTSSSVESLVSQRQPALVNGTRWGNPNATLYDKRECRTKTAVTAVYRGTPRNGSATLLRSYDSRKEPAPEFNCTVWQAGRATSATGLAFKPIQIGQHVFIDEGAGTYNPAPDTLDEATVNEWPGREVGVFVSVGTGKRPSGTDNQQHEWWEDFFGDALGAYAEARRRLMTKIEGCEQIHQAMLKDHLPKRHVSKDNYYRLNVEVGVGEFGMNEWNRLADISTNTRRYLGRNDVQRMGMNAAMKLAKIYRMHRRLTAHAAAAKLHGEGSISKTRPPYPPVPPFIPPQLRPAPANIMAVELPADVPGEFLYQPPHAAARQNSQPSSQETLTIMGPDEFSLSGNGSHHHTSSQQIGSPPPGRLSGDLRMSIDSSNGVTLPPRPPKTPIPYPDGGGGGDGGITMPFPPPNPAHSTSSLNGHPRPPYPVDEPPPTVDRGNKPIWEVR